MSSHDLRSHAIESKRFRDNKAKWAHGPAAVSSGKVTADGEAFHRPMSQHTANRLACCSSWLGELRPNSKARHVRGDIDREQRHWSETSTSDLDSAGSSPNSDVMYSFDAPGPQHGSKILASAVEKAVERFEVRETERLVKDEYEVIREEPAEREKIEDDGFELL
ncbi:MAG: hypothetical protein M1814_005937 [Vezdaea aestivalis]|nr:MAG: hypothetical protein M1814_005937 [Vezdaea aestivalis]